MKYMLILFIPPLVHNCCPFGHHNIMYISKSQSLLNVRKAKFCYQIHQIKRKHKLSNSSQELGLSKL